MNTTSTEHRDATAPRRRLTHLSPKRLSGLSAPDLWGIVGGAAVVATPLGLWWLPLANCLRLELNPHRFGQHRFSVADGRPKVIVELGVVTAFVVLAAMAITGGSAPSTPPRSAG
jgi:hypothetical protein